MWFLIRKYIQKQNSIDIYKLKNVKKQKVEIDKVNDTLRIQTQYFKTFGG